MSETEANKYDVLAVRFAQKIAEDSIDKICKGFENIVSQSKQNIKTENFIPGPYSDTGVELQRDCLNCKHRYCSSYTEPCQTCLMDERPYLLIKWEPCDADTPR